MACIESGTKLDFKTTTVLGILRNKIILDYYHHRQAESYLKVQAMVAATVFEKVSDKNCLSNALDDLYEHLFFHKPKKKLTEEEKYVLAARVAEQLYSEGKRESAEFTISEVEDLLAHAPSERGTTKQDELDALAQRYTALFGDNKDG